MFKRICLVIVLFATLFPSGAPAAGASEGFDSGTLKNYFVFDQGTWWDYVRTADLSKNSEITDQLNVTNNVEDATRKVTAVPCKYTDCTTFESGTSTYSYAVDGTGVYMVMRNNEAVGDIKMLDVGGFSNEVGEAIQNLYGINGSKNIDGKQSCEFTDYGNKELAGFTGGMIENICTLSFDYSDAVYGAAPTMMVVSKDVYMENVGLIYSEAKFFLDNEWQYTLTDILTDSSLGQVDWSTDTSTDTATIETQDVSTASDTITVDNPFNDLLTTHRNYDAITYLYGQGLINGYDDGTFRPYASLKRADLLKILVAGRGVTPDSATYHDCFTDVTTDWYAPSVCYAKEQGWVSGYPDGSFRPADTVNKAEALKMLLNSQDIETTTPTVAPFTDVSVSDWFAPYVVKAKELGILEETGAPFLPYGDRTRGGLSENLYRLLLSLQVSNVSDAMAQSTCLAFDTSTAKSELDQEVQQIMEDHGFKDAAEIDDYLALIQNLLIYSQLSSQLQADLEIQCGSELTDQGVNIQDLVNAMITSS